MLVHHLLHHGHHHNIVSQSHRGNLIHYQSYKILLKLFEPIIVMIFHDNVCLWEMLYTVGAN